MTQARAIIITGMMSIGLLGLYWGAGAQEGRSLWTPPAVLPSDELRSPVPSPPPLPAPTVKATDKQKAEAFPSVPGPVPMATPVAPSTKEPRSAKRSEIRQAVAVEEPELPLIPATGPTPVSQPPMFPGPLPVPPQTPAPGDPAAAEPKAAPLPTPILPPSPSLPLEATPVKPLVTQGVNDPSTPAALIKIPGPDAVVLPGNVIETVPEGKNPMGKAPPAAEAAASKPQMNSFVRIRPTSRPSAAIPSPIVDSTSAAQVGGTALRGPNPAEIRGTAPLPSAQGDLLVNLQTPALMVEKRHGLPSRAGEPQQYEIIVRNVGSAPAQQVRIEDELPPQCRVVGATPAAQMQGNKLSWLLPVLAPQAEVTLRLALDGSVPIESMKNTSVGVFASSNPGQAGAGRVTVTAQRPRIDPDALSVRLVGPTQAMLGRPLVFEIYVTNRSSEPCKDLVLAGFLPDELDTPQGRRIIADVNAVLQPGETKKLRLPANAVKTGRCTVEVKVTSAAGHEASAQASLGIGADTLLLQQGVTSRLFVGRDGECRIEITNLTDRPMRNVTVVNQLADGLDFVSASDRGLYQANSRAIHWLIEQVPAGQRQTLSFAMHAMKAGQYQNQVTARADGAVETRSIAAILVETHSDLALKVVCLDKQLEVGRETIYEIQVVNSGNAPTTNVLLQVQFPAGLAPKTAPANARFSADRQTIVFDPVSYLAPQGQAVFRVAALAKAPGDQHIRFAVASDEVRTPVQSETSTVVYRD